jgi:PHD/YefM family antitoxin component YafN of YafNO toxin-antitoxin module
MLRDIRIFRVFRGYIMIRVSSTDFGKEVGRYQDMALSQPVIVTRNGRDRTVMISADEYLRLKRRDRQVVAIEDFSEAEVEAVRNAQPSEASAAFDHELK